MGVWQLIKGRACDEGIARNENRPFFPKCEIAYLDNQRTNGTNQPIRNFELVRGRFYVGFWPRQIIHNVWCIPRPFTNEARCITLDVQLKTHVEVVNRTAGIVGGYWIEVKDRAFELQRMTQVLA